MLGLMIKDFYLSKKYFRSVFLIIAMFTLFSVLGQSTFLSGIITLFFAMVSITTCAYDDLAKWDKYALTMPVTRSDVVFAKYTVMLLFSVTGTLISVLIAIISCLVKGAPITGDLFLSAVLILEIALLMMSILLPLIYKFGVEKARLMLMIVVMVPTMAIVFLQQAGFSIPNAGIIQMLLSFSPLILLVIMGISFWVSNGLYQKKEL